MLSSLWSWIGLPYKSRNRATVSTSFVLSRWIDLWHNPSRPSPSPCACRPGRKHTVWSHQLASVYAGTVWSSSAFSTATHPDITSHSLSAVLGFTESKRRVGDPFAASLWVPLKFKIPRMECRVAEQACLLPKWVVHQWQRDSSGLCPPLLCFCVGLRNRPRMGTA